MAPDLQRLIRERFPFPIAHAHKKIQAIPDDDAQKLKCLIQTAEAIVQFLALTVLAQLQRDLISGQAPPLGPDGLKLREELRNPSFGKWQSIIRNTLKHYRDHQKLLVIPELFAFYFKPTRGKKLALQPVVSQCIDPLITLRNQFHHPGIPDNQVADKTAEGLHNLDTLLTQLQFLSEYQLAFVQDVKVRRQDHQQRFYSHDLVQMQGCFSVFDRARWDSDIDLQHERVVLLDTEANDRSLLLDPFITVADQVPFPGVMDIFLLNGTADRRARYLSVQFGQELPTDETAWPKGGAHFESLSQFFERLTMSRTG